MSETSGTLATFKGALWAGVHSGTSQSHSGPRVEMQLGVDLAVAEDVSWVAYYGMCSAWRWDMLQWPRAFIRKRAEYCFESTVSEERTHWVLRQTRLALPKNSVSSHLHTNNRLELTEFAPRNSVSPENLTELCVWNSTPRNCIQPVSEKISCKVAQEAKQNQQPEPSEPFSHPVLLFLGSSVQGKENLQGDKDFYPHRTSKSPQ